MDGGKSQKPTPRERGESPFQRWERSNRLGEERTGGDLQKEGKSRYGGLCLRKEVLWEEEKEHVTMWKRGGPSLGRFFWEGGISPRPFRHEGKKRTTPPQKPVQELELPLKHRTRRTKGKKKRDLSYSRGGGEPIGGLLFSITGEKKRQDR